MKFLNIFMILPYSTLFLPQMNLCDLESKFFFDEFIW